MIQATNNSELIHSLMQWTVYISSDKGSTCDDRAVVPAGDFLGNGWFMVACLRHLTVLVGVALIRQYQHSVRSLLCRRYYILTKGPTERIR